MTTIIYHSADFDGIFCREIARKFLGNEEVQYIGWNFCDAPIPMPADGPIYIMDLPADEPLGFKFSAGKRMPVELQARITWIDHHGSSIASHPTDLSGYRIDGVAACRLAWQWFDTLQRNTGTACGFIIGTTATAILATKQDFVDRKVSEPLAVRLAGEYDIWDDWREDWNNIVAFQFGLKSFDVTGHVWSGLLETLREPGARPCNERIVDDLLEAGRRTRFYQQSNDASVANSRSFLMEFEGLKFLALNTARCNSLTFAAKDVPETGHDALCSFCWDGKAWAVSLYHAKHRKDIDLSLIAVKHTQGCRGISLDRSGQCLWWQLERTIPRMAGGRR